MTNDKLAATGYTGTPWQIIFDHIAHHQPRHMSGVLCWPEPASGIASEIVAALTDAGHLPPVLIDFPEQRCLLCGTEHPGQPCDQPDLFGEPA